MTIKRSLILSHVSMCILPFLMTFFVLKSSFSGLYLYAKSGNHVMAESGFQFQAMSQVVRALIFHHIRQLKGGARGSLGTGYPGSDPVVCGALPGWGSHSAVWE